MTSDEIIETLKSGFAEGSVADSIRMLKQEAIAREDEVSANSLWCCETIHAIQSNYLMAYEHMRLAVDSSCELVGDGYDSPKSQEYEKAWNALDCCDIMIGELEDNYCIDDYRLEDFRIPFILADVQRLQLLFPYKYFFSREMVVSRMECSLCGKTVKVRHPCGHTKGRVYMGRLCHHVITDARIIAICIVTDPHDRFAIAKLKGHAFDFSALDYIIPRIWPYVEWSYSGERSPSAESY